MPGETDRYVRGFTAQLRRGGVAHAVICPGSRSTPLTLAFTRDANYRCWLHLDERSAAYFALGLARQLGEPVALVCTSGTAAANFLPAVVEASLSRVPLVVLTADRPPELRDVGGPQTIDQVHMYGSHVRWAVDMPLADGSAALERFGRGAAARAAELARGPRAGPVHLNFPFREPLVDPLDDPGVSADDSDEVEADTESGARPSAGAGAGETRVRPSEASPAPETVEALVGAFTGRRGLIVCGPESGGLPAREITALAAALDWPVLADPLSGVRVGRHELDHVVETYDTLVRVPEFAASAVPEVVLRFGAAPTSKALNQWLLSHAAIGQDVGQDVGHDVGYDVGQNVGQYVVDVAGGWRDPDATAAEMVRADPAALCLALLARLGRSAAADPAWRARWSAANRVAARALREALDGIDEPFEGRAPVELAEALPDGSTLVVGNSMPVRDTDSFLPALARELRIVGTRGASGIDGVVSTAVGAAAARGGPVALLIGDLSFFHDLNGLWPLRRYGLDLTVLLVHNDGGGIFHFLPQAKAAPALSPQLFEEWFATPHGLDFRGAVEMHGGSYRRLEGSRGWSAALSEAVRAPGLSVLELRTDRERNVELHRQALGHVREALRATVETEG